MTEKPGNANQFFATSPAAMEKIKQIEEHCEQTTGHNLQWVEGDSNLAYQITDKVKKDDYSGKFYVVIEVKRMTGDDMVDWGSFKISEDGTISDDGPQSFKNLS